MEDDAAAGLELVRAFVNTRDVEEDVDALESPEALVAWLRERELAGTATAATERDRARALSLREALRDHLLANDGAALPVESAEVVERQARRSRLRLEIRTGEAVVSSSAPGVDGALGEILAAIARAMLNGTWARLKACAADTCRWAYVDRSRNRSRHWCAMEVCGNREKVRAFRARQGRADEA
jgi:predicted RNA-binding Zn ribbon-like protein